MSRILFTTMPITGHVRPGLPVARELVAAGHEVLWYTGSKFEPIVTGVGAEFAPIVDGLDYDDAEIGTVGDGGEGRSGLSHLRWAVLNIFVKPVPGYVGDLEKVCDRFDPDVVVADHAFAAGPLLAQQRGIPHVVYSVSPLSVSSVDAAPFGFGLAPSSSLAGRLRNRSLNWAVRAVVFGDSQRVAVQLRASMGLPPMDGYFMDWAVRSADRYIHASIPEFEYPHRDLPDAVEFVGAMLPRGVDNWTPPRWWPEIAEARRCGRPVVLVTQGTLATEPTNLLLPAIEALRASDALVVGTTGGPEPDDVLPPGQRPANLRLERFVPFPELLPHTDLMVTNGGYGGVQMSLAYGVPLVVAGRTEDKMEVSARVSWAGVGVSLRTDTPSVRQVADAVAEVLGSPRYGDRARELAAVYARYGGASRAADVVLETASAGRAATLSC